MSRASRVAAFRRQIGSSPLDTSLLVVGRHRGCDSAAIAHWRMTEAATNPVCFGCSRRFSVEIRPGAFLTATIANRSPKAGTAVAGLCLFCWSGMAPAEIEASAAALLRRQLSGPHGKLLDDGVRPCPTRAR
jgi:hypothetical protein